MIITYYRPNDVPFTNDINDIDAYILALPDFLSENNLNQSTIDGLNEHLEYNLSYFHFEHHEEMLHVHKSSYYTDKNDLFLSVYFIFEIKDDSEYYQLKQISVSFQSKQSLEFYANFETTVFQFERLFQLYHFIKEHPFYIKEKTIENFFSTFNSYCKDASIIDFHFNEHLLHRQLINFNKFYTFDITQIFNTEIIQRVKIELEPYNHYAKAFIIYKKDMVELFNDVYTIRTLSLSCPDTETDTWYFKRARLHHGNGDFECHNDGQRLKANHSTKEYSIKDINIDTANIKVAYHQSNVFPSVQSVSLISPLFIYSGIECRFEFNINGELIKKRRIVDQHHYHYEFFNLNLEHQVIACWIMNACPDRHYFIKSQILEPNQSVYELTQEQMDVIIFNFQDLSYYLNEFRTINSVYLKLISIINQSQKHNEVTSFIENQLKQLETLSHF